MQLEEERSSHSDGVFSDSEEDQCESITASVSQMTCNSQDTLVYNKNDPNFESFVNEAVERRISVDSLATRLDDTQRISQNIVFHQEARNFNLKRCMPLIETTLKPGSFLFPSKEVYINYKAIDTATPSVEVDRLIERDLALPLFYIAQPHFFSLRKNCPSIIIYKYFPQKERLKRIEKKAKDPQLYKDLDVEKYPFCKVHSKFVKSGKIRRYTLEFTPDPDSLHSFTLPIFKNRLKPYADTIYKDTRLRWVGITPVSAVYGSGEFKLMVVADKYPHLMDNLKSDLKPDPKNPLLKEMTVSADLCGASNKRYESSELPSFGKFSDQAADFFPKKYSCEGHFTFFDAADIKDLAKDSLKTVQKVGIDVMVLACMGIALKDQEAKKCSNTLNRRLSRDNGYGPSVYMPFDTSAVRF